MSSVRDIARLLLLHLREGECEGQQVLSPDAVRSMQINRIEGLTNLIYPDRSYGMGWWGRNDIPPYIIFDSGGFGDIAWIDTQRQIGGFVAVDDYSKKDPFEYLNLVLFDLFYVVEEIVDKAQPVVR